MVFFGYGLVLNTFNIEIIPSTLEHNHPDLFYDYRGITNLQTQKSTGSGTIDKIANAAREAEVDFVFLTDLNLSPSEEQFEGYKENVLFIKAAKYSFLDSRILVYKSDSIFNQSSSYKVNGIFSDIFSGGESENNFLALAHPFKNGFRWNGPLPAAINGIEVINLKSVWQKSWLESKFSFFWTLFTYPFNPRLAFIRLFENQKQQLKFWDQVTKIRPLVGLAGTDAEAKVKGVLGGNFEFPSYENLFEVVSNHVLLNSELTGDAARDKLKIIEALSNGQFYFSLDLLANPKGFVAYIKGKDKVFPIGKTISFSKNLSLVVKLPTEPLVPYEIVVYKNGSKHFIINDVRGEIPIHEPGTYRIVVRVIPTLPLPDGKRWFTWIYTNPFYVRGLTSSSP